MTALLDQLASPDAEVAQHKHPRLYVARTLYFFFFAAFGVIVTYLNIYYHSIGLSGIQIGIINSVAPLVGIFAGPLWGLGSDRFGQTKLLIAVGILGTISMVWGLSLTQAFVWLLALTAAYTFFNNPILPLLDSTTLQLLGGRREDYGRERVWGSIGFIISAWGFGQILQTAGLHWMFLGFTSMMLATLVTLYWLPNRKSELNTQLIPGLSQMMGTRPWLFFSSSLLVFGFGNSAFHNFSGIYLKELGASEGLIGSVAALGTLTELPILFLGAALILRWRPWRLLMVAYLVAIIRWLLYSLIPTPEWALPVSLLHSVAFGVYWIAGVAYVDELAPENLKATAQGLFYGTFALSSALVSPINGYIFDSFGGADLFRLSAVFGLLAVLLLWLGKPKVGPAAGLSILAESDAPR